MTERALSPRYLDLDVLLILKQEKPLMTDLFMRRLFFQLENDAK